jgi:hypothetical protein
MKNETIRLFKYKAKLKPETIKARIDSQRKNIISQKTAKTLKEVQIEEQVKNICRNEKSILLFEYLAYAKKIWHVVEKHGPDPRFLQTFFNAWTDRGLKPNLLNAINVQVFSSRELEPYKSIGGEVLFIPFSEGSGDTAADASGNGNNATLQNVTWQKEKMGFSTFYNGTDAEATIQPSTSISNIFNRLTGGFAVSFWVKRAINPEPPFAGIVTIQDIFRFGCGSSGERFDVYFYTPSRTLELVDMGPIGYNPFNWCHCYFGVSWDFTTSNRISYEVRFNYYSLISANPSGFSPITFTNNLTKLGIDYNFTNNRLNGFIDNVRFYNRKLKPEEILQIYNTEKQNYYE